VYRRVRRSLFIVLFIINVGVVGVMVNAKYGSAVEIVGFTMVGATIATVVMSLVSFPFVAIGVWLGNKYSSRKPEDPSQRT
jgi:quinol-cytochrome oxidoreductase complex cytochrome b subunit